MVPLPATVKNKVKTANDNYAEAYALREKRKDSAYAAVNGSIKDLLELDFNALINWWSRSQSSTPEIKVLRWVDALGDVTGEMYIGSAGEVLIRETTEGKQGPTISQASTYMFPHNIVSADYTAADGSKVEWNKDLADLENFVNGAIISALCPVFVDADNALEAEKAKINEKKRK